MKHVLFTLFSLVVGTVAAVAQTVNVNHSGIQTTYDATTVTEIGFADDGAQMSVVRGTESPLVVATSDVTSIECSAAAPDFCRKTVDGVPAQFVFSCIEVNNTNPLQTLNFRLGTANKYLFDGVILFSSNINFSKKEDVVYIHNNDNVQAILNNYDHYIRPIKERGIKVFLSILGNHDGSGLSNMSDDRCRKFAQAIADTLDKYDLDGVFFDDEYSDYTDPSKDLGGQGFAGFQPKGTSACASRLAYETKKAIGQRWVVAYKYGAFNSLGEVEGKKPGEFVDYILTDYGVVGNWTNNQRSYPGSERSQWGICSVNLGGYTNFTFLKHSRTEKYGALMIYNLDQESGNYDYVYYDILLKITKNLFDDTLVVDPTHYKKDWTPVPGLSEPNR